MDGDSASGLHARLEAWRAQGADRIDPVRFGLIAALARRTPAYQGEARRLLDARLARLVESYARDVAQRHGIEAGAGPAAPGALAALLPHMPHRIAVDAAYPALPLLQHFPRLWSGLRTDAQVRQSLEPVAADAGPLNSTVLVHRSLTLMRALSPGYLQHFIAYVDALSSLEPLLAGDAPVAAGAAPRPDGTRKPARGRARKPRA